MARSDAQQRAHDVVAVRVSCYRRYYGITIRDYEDMFTDQFGMCAICDGTNPSGHHLAVDHCHDTGRVRGLLCHACNAGMGKLRDDPALLRRAATYLEKE